MVTKPFPYQMEGVEFIESHNGNALLGDEMGLGKTFQALYSLYRNPEWLPALVICNAGLKFVWHDEAERHVGMRSYVCEGRKPPKDFARILNEYQLIIINYEILWYWRECLLGAGFNILLIDECQNFANPRARRTKAGRQIAQQIQRTIAMSGTAMLSRPIELFTVLNMLWPDTFKSQWSFAQRYCEPKSTIQISCCILILYS